MRDDTIAAFLDQLAARVPAPGGGATAALHAAQAAALLAMVARYSDGPRYDAGLMNRIVAEADELREDALALADADATAFGAVAEAYRLPRSGKPRPVRRPYPQPWPAPHVLPPMLCARPSSWSAWPRTCGRPGTAA
jgi:formiminotetrahydrofolate cyclodeaminase